MNSQLLDEAGRDGTRRDETGRDEKNTQIQCNIYFHLKTKILFK